MKNLMLILCVGLLLQGCSDRYLVKDGFYLDPDNHNVLIRNKTSEQNGVLYIDFREWFYMAPAKQYCFFDAKSWLSWNPSTKGRVSVYDMEKNKSCKAYDELNPDHQGRYDIASGIWYKKQLKR